MSHFQRVKVTDFRLPNITLQTLYEIILCICTIQICGYLKKKYIECYTHGSVKTVQ